MSSSVRVDGLRRLAADMRRAGADMADLKEANARAGALVVAASSSRAPRRSGRLAGSGRPSRTTGRASVLFGGTAAPYAGPIHYGWPARGIDPQPFVLEAAAATQSSWLPLYEAELQQLIDRHLGGNTY